MLPVERHGGRVARRRARVGTMMASYGDECSGRWSRACPANNGNARYSGIRGVAACGLLSVERLRGGRPGGQVVGRVRGQAIARLRLPMFTRKSGAARVRWERWRACARQAGAVRENARTRARAVVGVGRQGGGEG